MHLSYLESASFVFTSWASFPQALPWGVAVVWWLLIFFSFLSFLRAHRLTLKGCNHWWRWHLCCLIWQEIFHFSAQTPRVQLREFFSISKFSESKQRTSGKPLRERRVIHAWGRWHSFRNRVISQMRVWLQSRKKPVNRQTTDVPQGENRPSVTSPKGLPVMDVSPEPAYVMLREGWDRGFPGEVSTLILPQGQCSNSLIQDCQTDTHIHHVSAIRLEEIEIAQKVRLVLWCRNIGWEFSGVSEWVAAHQLSTALRAEGWTEVTFPPYLLQMCWAQGCPLYTCRLISFFIEEWKIKVRFLFNSESTVEGLAQGM